MLRVRWEASRPSSLQSLFGQVPEVQVLYVRQVAWILTCCLQEVLRSVAALQVQVLETAVVALVEEADSCYYADLEAR